MPTAPRLRIVHGDRTHSPTEVSALAQSWARALQAAGVGAREPVGLESAARPACLVGLFAIRMANATPVLLHPNATPAEVRELLGDAGARLLLAATPDFGAGFPNRTAVSLEKTPVPSALRGPIRTVGSDYLLYTSGTEGRPKGVLLTDSGFAAHSEASRGRSRSDARDRWLASLALSHVGGLAMVLRAHHLAATLVLPPTPLPQDLDPLTVRHEITHLSIVPTQLLRWLEARSPQPPPASLRCILVGGAGCPPGLLERATDAGLPVRYTYGLTETSSQVATAGPDTPLGSVGTPLPGVEVKIVGADGQGVAAGAPGEIRVRGPTTSLGYLRRGPWPDGWVPTGDHGHLDPQGNLWVLGRASDLIISGGENVDPAEVEAVLQTHPEVAEACVVGLPDATWGHRVTAVLVARTDPPPAGADLRGFAKASLAPYKCPQSFVFVDQLPRTRSGKLRRGEVRARLLRADGAHVRVHDPARQGPRDDPGEAAR